VRKEVTSKGIVLSLTEVAVQEADHLLTGTSTEETERRVILPQDQEVLLQEITGKRGEAHQATAEVQAAERAMQEVEADTIQRVETRVQKDEQLYLFGI